MKAFLNRFLGVVLWALLATPSLGNEVNLVLNSRFESTTGTTALPDHYALGGAAFWGFLGGSYDFATNGIIFPGNAPSGGSVGQLVKGLDQAKGRWITFRFRGLAEDGFSVPDNSLEMKIEFYSKSGTDYLDCASKPIYPEIEMDRKNLSVNGDYHTRGAAVWRSYEMEELIPFPEVDAVRISVLYRQGLATAQTHSAFLIDDFSLIQHIKTQTGKVDPAAAHGASPTRNVDPADLTALGGRWYYEKQAGETVSLTPETPLIVTENNADRLFYKSDRFINPFLNNMTAWMHAGYLDLEGNTVTHDTFVPDNVTLIFKGDGFLTVRARNLPNHPTAKFPGYNPNAIQEQDNNYKLPLEPALNPDAVAMEDEHNTNHALNMGPIGLAVNGVVFFNPFDAGLNDATNIMDYCCGHASPSNQYHYHKYPICVNTPFVDKGDGPSEVIGFAFDGLPIYGPYEAAGIMAKDSTSHPLNKFNASYDDVRGWHYNVTPGKFPYIIGGYFARVELSNLKRPHRLVFGGATRAEP